MVGRNSLLGVRVFEMSWPVAHLFGIPPTRLCLRRCVRQGRGCFANADPIRDRAPYGAVVQSSGAAVHNGFLALRYGVTPLY